MDEQELQKALEHDAARRGHDVVKVDPVKLAAHCCENAHVAARGAVAGLMNCKPPALPEVRAICQMAIQSLEQALVLMSLEEPFDV